MFVKEGCVASLYRVVTLLHSERQASKVMRCKVSPKHSGCCDRESYGKPQVDLHLLDLTILTRAWSQEVLMECNVESPQVLPIARSRSLLSSQIKLYSVSRCILFLNTKQQAASTKDPTDIKACCMALLHWRLPDTDLL